MLLKPDLDETNINIDNEWTSYAVAPFPSHSADCIVLFRPRPPIDFIGCIRVREKQSTKARRCCQKGVFIGYVPEGCSSEAISVEMRYITWRC